MSNLSEIKERHVRDHWKDAVFIAARGAVDCVVGRLGHLEGGWPSVAASMVVDGGREPGAREVADEPRHRQAINEPVRLTPATQPPHPRAQAARRRGRNT